MWTCLWTLLNNYLYYEFLIRNILYRIRAKFGAFLVNVLIRWRLFENGPQCIASKHTVTDTSCYKSLGPVTQTIEPCKTAACVCKCMYNAVGSRPYACTVGHSDSEDDQVLLLYITNKRKHRKVKNLGAWNTAAEGSSCSPVLECTFRANAFI